MYFGEWFMKSFLLFVFLGSTVLAQFGLANEVNSAPDKYKKRVTINSNSNPNSNSKFTWSNATVYFLLTDRFANGNKNNDHAYGRKDDGAILRGYLGGDLVGITQKIKEGYFNQLGIDALWITPPVEQIHANTNEGTGNTYAFHGYWAKDFTRVDANLGSDADFSLLVKTAHAHGIRILLDVVMNHLGPVTQNDPTWPDDWVRTEPACDYKTVKGTIECTLVKNLPDLKTESHVEVELPPTLVKAWKEQGRYEKEEQELSAFFSRTKLPKTPKNYLIKWHTDWIRKYGVDGFRVDTVKHVEPEVWNDLKRESLLAYEEWKAANPSEKLGNQTFFMTAEVYNYKISDGLNFPMDGGIFVNYFKNGFDSMINFEFKTDAENHYEKIFNSYSEKLNSELQGYSIMNYISSHDDSHPFDPQRTRNFEAATKLLLSPGAVQIYYGDEVARPLMYSGAVGDANLRTMMDWSTVNSQRLIPNDSTKKSYLQLLEHWRKLAKFRQLHPAVGAGKHQQLNNAPYVFSRILKTNNIMDKVVVALDLPDTKVHHIKVDKVFSNGQILKEYYSGKKFVVKNGVVTIHSRQDIVLLGLE
jgi:alpha-amylase